MQRGLTYFVEKHSAAIGIFEETRPSIRCASERTANVAKKLTFKKRVNKSGTVADGEALLSDRTHVMQSASDEFFARAGGAGDENVRIVTRDFLGQVKNFEHCRTSPDDAVELEVL